MVAAIVSSSIGKEEARLSESLLLRVTNLSSAVSSYSKNLKSSSLRASAAQLSTVLESDKANFTAYFADKGVTVSSASSEVKTSEDDIKTELEDNLKNAKLTGRLDSEFARLMALQLNLLSSLTHNLSGKTSSSDLTTLLETSDVNLSPLAVKFDEFGV
jgi:hypothetical protein